MNIDILTIGRIGEKPYQQLCEQYLKRCTGKSRISLVHCRNEQEVLRKITGRKCIIGLDEYGKQRTSMEFSAWLNGKIIAGENHLTFCLGPAAGLGNKTKGVCTEFISVSSFTLNHQLALLVLCEQLYRGLAILFGEPYHKA